MKYCKNCGQELVDEAVICIKCGVSQESEASKPTPTKSRTINVKQLVWSIINFFVGGAGGGISSILAIIAFVMTLVAMGAKTDEEEAKHLKVARILNIIATVLICVSLGLALLAVLLYVAIYVLGIILAFGSMFFVMG